MEKLSYKPYSSSISDVVFLETNNYYDPSSPMDTRKQLSYPLKEVKDFVNNTVSVDSSDNAVQLVVANDTLKYRSEPDGALVNVPITSHDLPSGGSSGQVLKKNSGTNYDVGWKDNTVTVLTTAPTGNNTDGVKIVYLTSEPATKYSGYIYLIKE